MTWNGIGSRQRNSERARKVKPKVTLAGTICTCTARPARATDIDPPEVRRDRRCPIHGDLRHTDPDAARDARLERDLWPTSLPDDPE